MKKRQFLGRAALAGMAAAALPATAQAAASKTAGPALLTVTGAIGKVNRGRFDPVRDQMMFKQKLGFDKAHAFDFAALAALPAITIAPTLEYDNKVHTLRGPLLLDVMKAAGASPGDSGKLVLRAVDGYAATITVAQARAQRYIVATHLDGAAMALGGLGPLWAIYDADKVHEMAVKPLAERFGSCPWALYHIEVQA
ncbi:molybdopterin-dependent oxidoreductase [Rugamonas aquatica]|uniref:Molybdopterin-dependent oxidoreductase n=1 Tax=Rugamonas aquatica TaxID=2743357 RepID=A0A6A7N0J8_9BURK|nr:molybdopterin-dependent oxidoreductase [Rugamonas aquatica]MQA38440.1 molybdopterin-dependent oxidoreductase [Rugamonas aquatica]